LRFTYAPNRDLQALASFDVTRARPQLATDVGRFTAGSMIAELSLRWASDEPSPGLFDAVELALDKVAAAPPGESIEAALAGAWHIIATLGFTPALDVCANCHADLDPAARVVFSHSAGGALCANCGKLAAGSRVIPATARNAVREWTSGGGSPIGDDSEARAHQRLLREFFQEHLGAEKELRAYRVWELGAWSAA
jgi:Recombinational DNA repair protein (RecF pathway)